MADEPFYSPNRRAAPRRQPTPGEHLFAFVRGDDRFVCELRDQGEFGVEAQVFENGEILTARTFGPWRDRSRPPRERAIAWAEEERQAIEGV